jgi:RNA polymerase-binding transcription factor DksA
MRFDAPTVARLRKGIMRRGLTLSTLLAEVLAGKDKGSALDALLGAKPGMRPEERLRLALDQVEGRRALIDADDDRYGRCDICGADLGLPALDEQPWSDRCQAHSGA